MAWDSQDGFAVRFDWGAAGVKRLASNVDVVVVVDVLRFTTAVSTAVDGGVIVYPYRWPDDTAGDYARSLGAILAESGEYGPSLCPASLRRLEPETQVVLPSPNGATCCLEASAAGARVVAGCLRNAAAVAAWLGQRSSVVGVVACGEIWQDGSLLPAIEDVLGAGAIIAELPGERSPEAAVAEAAFGGALSRLEQLLTESSSGRALRQRGHAEDVLWAAEVSVSRRVPVLEDRRFVGAS